MLTLEFGLKIQGLFPLASDISSPNACLKVR